MKRVLMVLIVVLLFVGVNGAQTKTMTGRVVDRQVGNSGKWAGIVIKAGNKKYFVYTESVDMATPGTVGTIDEVGRVVRVFYTKILNSPGYDGELRASRIIEVRKTKSRKN